MTQPTPFVRGFDFTNFSQDFPSVQQPGAQIDAEFDGVHETLSDVLTSLARIQRDDGQLLNGSVRLATLHSEVLAAFLAAGVSVTAWASGQAYKVGQIVINGDEIYLVGITHTSASIFADTAANKLVRIFDSGANIRASLGAAASDPDFTVDLFDRDDVLLNGDEGWIGLGAGGSTVGIFNGEVYEPNQINFYLKRVYPSPSSRQRWVWFTVRFDHNSDVPTIDVNGSTIAFSDNVAALSNLAAHTEFTRRDWTVKTTIAGTGLPDAGGGFFLVGSGGYREIPGGVEKTVAVGVDLDTQQCFVLDPYQKLIPLDHPGVTTANTAEYYIQQFNTPVAVTTTAFKPRFLRAGTGRIGLYNLPASSGAASASEISSLAGKAGVNEKVQIAAFTVTVPGFLRVVAAGSFGDPLISGDLKVSARIADGSRAIFTCKVRAQPGSQPVIIVDPDRDIFGTSPISEIRASAGADPFAELSLYFPNADTGANKVFVDDIEWVGVGIVDAVPVGQAELALVETVPVAAAAASANFTTTIDDEGYHSICIGTAFAGEGIATGFKIRAISEVSASYIEGFASGKVAEAGLSLGKIICRHQVSRVVTGLKISRDSAGVDGEGVRLDLYASADSPTYPFTLSVEFDGLAARTDVELQPTSLPTAEKLLDLVDDASDTVTASTLAALLTAPSGGATIDSQSRTAIAATIAATQAIETKFNALLVIAKSRGIIV